MYANTTRRLAISRINQTPESGKKTRESRTPKSNPKMILILSTNGRIFAFTTSASGFSAWQFKGQSGNFNGVARQSQEFHKKLAECEL